MWKESGIVALVRLVGVGTVLLGLLGCRAGGPASVFYINSYHAGYGSSDDVMAGIQETLSASGVRLTPFFLDAKRHAESAADRANEALEAIKKARPDVIIASDDDAVKHVVAGHFKNGPIPCVFCGVNWTCEQYGLPTAHVTGMLEISPVRETIATLRKYYPDAKRLVVLSENTLSEQKNRETLVPIFTEMGLTTDYVLVDTFEQWKERFRRANREADLVFLPTNGAIKGWDTADARAFVNQHLAVPVFTCDDFMMVYAVFGLTKVAREQGEWAAGTALEILKGRSPAAIPVTRNRQTVAWINPILAEKLGFKPGAELLSKCRWVE